MDASLREYNIEYNVKNVLLIYLYSIRRHFTTLHALSLCPPTFLCRIQYSVKKVRNFPVPSQDVFNQNIPGWELLNYFRPWRLWLVTSGLGKGQSLTFFTVYVAFLGGRGQWSHGDQYIETLSVNRFILRAYTSTCTP